MASEQEVITELMAKGNVVIRPVQDIMKGLKRFVDVMKEPFSTEFEYEDALPEEPAPGGAPDPQPGLSEAQPAHEWEDSLQDAMDAWSERLSARDQASRRRTSRSRSAERAPARTTVQEQIAKWQQMASANAARRLEGLPKLQRMPESIQHGETPDTWELDTENRVLIRRRNSWRSRMFVPTSLASCPVPADQFTGKRVTKWLDPQGGVGSFVDKWISARAPADRVYMKKWKGSTHVEYKEGYDVLAPKRKEFEEPPEPTTKKKRATSESKERRGRDKPESSTSSTPSATPGATTSQQPAAAADLGDRPESATSSTPSATPGASSDFRPEVFSLTEADKSANLDNETIMLVKKRIEQLQNDTDQGIKLNSLRLEIHRLRQEEKDLIKAIRRACENQEEAMVIEFDVDDLQACVASGATYAKNKMASNKEVNYRKLGRADRKRMDEAMAREISEVLRSRRAVGGGSQGSHYPNAMDPDMETGSRRTTANKFRERGQQRRRQVQGKGARGAHRVQAPGPCEEEYKDRAARTSHRLTYSESTWSEHAASSSSLRQAHHRVC